MTDELTVILPLLPTAFSVILAVMSSSEFDFASFIEPALRPGKKVAADLHNSSHQCPEISVEPFLRLSVARLQLTSFLLFLSVSLLSTVGLLVARVIAGLADVTAVFSFLFYFIGLLVLNFYFVIGRKDVFQWWRRPITRAPVIVAVGAITTIAGLRPDVVDLLGYFWNVQRSYVIVGYPVERIWIMFAVGVPVAVFLVTRVWVSRHRPGLRRLILMEMDKNRAGHTLDEWFQILIPVGHSYPSQEDVKEHLEELVYQGIATLTLASPTDSHPIYKKW